MMNGYKYRSMVFMVVKMQDASGFKCGNRLINNETLPILFSLIIFPLCTCRE